MWLSCFLFLNFLFYIGAQLINNIVLFSGVQQSDLVILSCFLENLLSMSNMTFRPLLPLPVALSQIRQKSEVEVME